MAYKKSFLLGASGFVDVVLFVENIVHNTLV